MHIKDPAASNIIEIDSYIIVFVYILKRLKESKMIKIKK